ncbi:hypothetical protein O181_042761 [Austropuccinia psidii MF-1]|uniref:Tf2-1-like SH3-like domain-containing protein n=1 Tax=Austropuccinia psidii MF-1 TaxID=1389203 RepID=A0A9Q3DM80_9BASI|nr:hypothetical protein [Austropuccinia psidii MF-1]
MDLPTLSFHAFLEEQWDEEEEPEEIETVLKVVPPAYHQYLEVFSKVEKYKILPHRAWIIILNWGVFYLQRFCSCGLEFKESDGFTHDWCTLIPAFEVSYKTSIHFSTGNTPAILEKGWNPRLNYDILKKDLVDIHPTASSFKIMLEKARHHANRCRQESCKYAKERWDKSHKPPDFKVGDLVLVSTLNVNHIKGPKKFKDLFVGPFMIKALHGPNAVQLELKGEPMNKHPAFPVSLIKPYSSSDKELFALRNKPPLKIPPPEG